MPPNSGHMLGLVEMTGAPTLPGLERSYSEEILQAEFESRMKRWVRPKDSLQTLPDNRVCVILDGVTSSSQVELAAAKLQRTFFEPHHHMGKSTTIAVRAGFAPYGGGSNEKSMSVAIQNAAQALNKAKASSRLFEIYSKSHARNERDQRKLLLRLEEALHRSEFELYYQPKIHATYGSLQGAEALMRWNKDGGPPVSAGEFIELAEQHDIIKPMTWWAIKSAIGHLSCWKHPISVAVNVSPALLLTDDIISVVQDALDIYAVDPALLVLEVTETIMIEDQGRMMDTLAKLRGLGVRIAIDDFGTGFSSLAYFRNLPADEIKIDQSFVKHMLVSEKDHAIVKAVIDLAHNFSLKVVAEGVESPEIAERLAELQCDTLQGYAFGKPMPVEAFEAQFKLR